MEIKINIKDTDKEEWIIPFNDIRPSSDNSVFFYLENNLEEDIKLEKITISSTAKASAIRVYQVVGEPTFSLVKTAEIFNKKLSRVEMKPDIFARFCSDASDLVSLGQLDRLDMLTELTTYETKPDVTLTPGIAVVLTCNSSLGSLSGIVRIIKEED